MPTLQVRDIRMYYEMHGQGEPLLLIPGLRSRVSDYGRVIDRLSTTFHVVAVDNRGAGFTDKPNAPYSIEMMADDAAGLLSALDLGQANVLGVSMGGRIAIDLALRHADLVRSLVLVATSARGAAKLGLFGNLLAVALRIPGLRSLGRDPQPYYAFMRQREASRNYDATARLSDIRVPTLIVHGTRDRRALLPHAQEMHEEIMGSQMVTLSGGHLILFFRTEACVAAITEFLRAAEASPAS
ncbi:MAG TPA: alpha/beta hydrolase [Thermoplasmata archaeon]|nr:alpha/beta hydrolase [Thermoplasmata archaeon]